MSSLVAGSPTFGKRVYVPAAAVEGLRRMAQTSKPESHQRPRPRALTGQIASSTSPFMT